MSPVASSARYSTYTFPSFTTAAGLNVAYSSQCTPLSFIGERNVEARLGAIAGFTCLGFSKGPNIHSRRCPRAGAPAKAASEHHSAAGTRKLIIPGPPGDAGTVVRRLSPHGCRVTCGPARVGATMPRPRSAGCDHGVSPMMCIIVEAMSLSVFGSGRSDVKTVAVFVNRRSLSGGFRIGVATNVAVTLAPVASVSTAQKDRPPKFPRLHVKVTRFNGSGSASPNTTPVAVSGPRLVNVIVKVMFSPTRTILRSATLVSARSAVPSTASVSPVEEPSGGPGAGAEGCAESFPHATETAAGRTALYSVGSARMLILSGRSSIHQHAWRGEGRRPAGQRSPSPRQRADVQSVGHPAPFAQAEKHRVPYRLIRDALEADARCGSGATSPRAGGLQLWRRGGTAVRADEP